MAAPTINREIVGPDHDPTHPIRDLNTIDLIAEKKTGDGMMLAIIAAGPLGEDSKTQTRLVEKVGAYLHYIASPEFKAEFADRPGKTSIVVKAHHGCAPAIRIVLKMCAKWAAESGVSVVLEIPEA
jgi:hypothetical protein